MNLLTLHGDSLRPKVYGRRPREPMKIAYFLPHPLPAWPEGHASRAICVAQAVEGVTVVDRPRSKEDWDLAIFDTFGEMPSWAVAEASRLVIAGVPIVSVARALNRPSTNPILPWSLVVQPGPYEGTEGEALAPLVRVAPVADTALDVLLVVSGRPGSDQYWTGVVNELREARLNFAVLADGLPVVGPHVSETHPGHEWIARSTVVVGGSGAGTLYEALWAGKRLVSHPFTIEQRLRLTAAQEAGEAVVDSKGSVVDAIESVRSMQPLGYRENGVPRLAALLRGLVAGPR